MAQAAARAMSYSADGAAAIAQYIAVNLTGTNDLIEAANVADQHILGILQNNVLANGYTQSVTVVDEGPTKAVAGAALATVGLPLRVDASGRVVTALGSAVVTSGANTSLIWAETAAGAGLIESVSYVNPGLINQVGYIELVGGNVIVHLSTDGAGAITETADSIKVLLAADATLAALVTATDSAGHDGTGVVTAEPAVSLTGADNIIGINRETASGAGSEIDIMLYGKAA